MHLRPPGSMDSATRQRGPRGSIQALLKLAWHSSHHSGMQKIAENFSASTIPINLSHACWPAIQLFRFISRRTARVRRGHGSSNLVAYNGLHPHSALHRMWQHRQPMSVQNHWTHIRVHWFLRRGHH